MTASCSRCYRRTSILGKQVRPLAGPACGAGTCSTTGLTPGQCSRPTRTQRSARPPPAVRGSAVTTRVKRRRGGRWALPPLSSGEDPGTRDSALVAIETRTKKGRHPEPPLAMRGCSNRQDPLLPGPLPHLCHFPLNADLHLVFEAGLLLWPQRFPSLSLVPAPIDAEVRRWDTRSTQGLRLRRESSPGCHSRARRSPYPSRRAPPHSLSCPIVGLRQRRSREHGE